MASNFSRDIDIISFWEESELEMFADGSVGKAARKERAHFEQEYSRFEELRWEYADMFDEKWFTRENYKWMYIHTVSRCFGSYLNSTYFVPFCELFNHSPVDVSYRCITNHPSQKATHTEQDGQEGDDEESISSLYSEDYLSDDDFDYMSISSYSIKWLSKVSYDLKEKEVKIIDRQLTEIYTYLHGQLEWRGFTLIYLGQIIEKLKIL